MLKIDHAPTFEAKVEPPRFNGKDRSFSAEFAVLRLSEMNAYDLGTGEGTEAFLRRAIVDVGDVEDNDGEPVSVADALPVLLDDPTIRIALVRAYFAGLAGAREGN